MSGKDERGAELRELFFETAAELLQSMKVRYNDAR
jgi:hypothetical protein